MKKLLQPLFFCCIVIVLGSCSTTAVVTKADQYYDDYNYPTAIRYYEYALQHGHENQQYIFKRIANAHRLQGDYVKAIEWYDKLVQFERVEPVEYFRYGKALESEKKFAAAQQWFEKYYEVDPKDSRAMIYRDYSVKYMSDLYEMDEEFEVYDVNAGTVYDEFCPAWYGENVVFCSNRPAEKLIQRTHDWNHTFYLDYYISERESDGRLKKPKAFDHLNTPYHEGALTFSSNGEFVVFTRNSSTPEGKLRNDDMNTVRLKLYSSQRVKEGNNWYWTEAKELPFNLDGYSCQHPSMSADGSKLYFASDMPGGHGGMDLYVVEKRGWSWGMPKNLGAKINTSGDEAFPFNYQDSLLYFSSNGHIGLGGLDIFVSEIAGYGRPTNLGFPINDVMDDFGFIIDAKGVHGYLSSNREGGKGRDDIYGFTAKEKIKLRPHLAQEDYAEESAEQILLPGSTAAKGNGRVKVVATGGIQVLVYDQITGKGLPNATINIFDKRGTLINAIQMKPDGTNRISHDYPSGELRFIAFYEDYSSNRVLIDMKDLSSSNGLIKIPMVKDLGKMMNINPIYFDYNKSAIRTDASVELDKIVKIMKDNPGMVIEVASHTDARGKHNYNMELSQQRAQSSMNYIISHGISASRISGRGYGETQPTNQCEDGISCDEVEHQYNRRTEFRILKF